MPDRVPLVEMRGISKRFGAVQALQDVHLTLAPGEVLGLVGDNSAGKSTLMKILAGALQPDGGQIFFRGEPVRLASPREARDLGIAMVYQDFALAENMDVAQNIFLGRWPGWFVVNRRAMDAAARAVLDELGIEMPSLRQPVALLSGGRKQAVAIARAYAASPQVLIMDEPTANLSQAAAQQVMGMVRTLKAKGVSVIIINHRIEEVFDVSDRIMVLKHGRNVGTRVTAQTHIDEIMALILRGEAVS